MTLSKHEWADAVQQSTFLGVKTLKNPVDAWIYQEIIVETKPDIIIETGSFLGGSALYLASICELIGHGKVYSIEFSKDRYEDCLKIRHPRLKFILGDSLNVELPIKDEKVMVILDSDHSAEHIEKEIQRFKNIVSSGQYLIVEDTFWDNPELNIDGFEIDKTRERFGMSHNPNGFLRKK
jgi:cephalosporin hydroxylase